VPIRVVPLALFGLHRAAGEVVLSELRGQGHGATVSVNVAAAQFVPNGRESIGGLVCWRSGGGLRVGDPGGLACWRSGGGLRVGDRGGLHVGDQEAVKSKILNSLVFQLVLNSFAVFCHKLVS